MKTPTVLFGAALALLSPSLRAEPPRGEIAIMGGWGTPAFNQDAVFNNYGPSLGLRGGAVIGKLWLGATVTYQFGMPQPGLYDVAADGSEFSSGYALSTLGVGGEIGLNLRWGPVTVRPYVWTGALVYNPSPLNQYTAATALRGPLVRFAVAPGLHADVDIGHTRFFVGADIRVNLIVPGTSPRISWDDATFAPDAWTNGDGSETFTGELTVFATIGRRF